MKIAKNTPTQLCPEKPKSEPSLPALSSLSAALHLYFTLSSSHHLPIIPHSPLTNTCTHACTHAISRTITRTPTSAAGISPMARAGRGPGGARLAPFTEPSPAFPPASPSAHTPFCQNYPTLTHTGTEKELAEYPHYAASLRQQKKEQRTTKNKRGGWLTELTKEEKQAEYGGRTHEKDFLPNLNEIWA